MARARYVISKSNAISSGEGRLTLSAKTYYPFWNRESFFLANARALRDNKDANGSEIYKSDGLIFTDAGSYLLPPVRGTKYQNPSRNRKYKQLHQLTIDFFIDEDKNSNLIITVGGSEKIGAEIKRTRIPFTGKPPYRVDPTQIEHSFVNSDGEKVVIAKGDIVECRWDKMLSMWIPIRLRDDRPEPNEQGVANDTWEMIIDNIPVGVLLGKLKGNKVLKLMSSYVNRTKITILNEWSGEIAKMLRKANEKRRPRLLDMGSGKGGDVKKWKQANLDVLAVEPAAEQLTELERRARDANIADRVQTMNIGIEKSDAILTKFTNLGLEKVDMVSSFHMMTFLYESAESVNGFIKTVTGVLKPGGILTIMAMDGLLIHSQLGSNVQAAIEGIKIQRSKEDPRKVMVKLRVNDARLARGQMEYLVDFDDLITRLEAAGFELISDSHLAPAIALNDSELWWSQMIRVIELRFFEIKKDVNTKSFDQLYEIMRGIDSNASPAVDESQEISPVDFLDDLHRGQTIHTVGVLGGGSCFLHSVMWAISQKYRDHNHTDRIKMVMMLRRELSDNFTPNEYLTLGNGNVKELGIAMKNEVDNIYSYRALKDGLADYSYWFGLEFIEFVSNQLEINIHLTWWRDGRLEIYKHAPDTVKTFVSTRSNIILYWQGGGHFQPIGRSQDKSSATFVFSSQDSMIANLLK